MFEINKRYWFRLRKYDGKELRLKGIVKEENGFMVKIQRDNGNIEYLNFNIILEVNVDKEQPTSVDPKFKEVIDNVIPGQEDE